LVQDLGGGKEWRVKLLNNGSAHCLEVSKVYSNGAELEDLFTWGSIWEYAFSDETYGWIGNGHGQDVQQTLSFEVDGQTVELGNGQRVTGRAARVIRQSHFEAPGPVALGDCTTIYSLDPVKGLSTEITIDWDIPPVAGNGGMMPLDNRFSRGMVVGCPESWDLTVGENTETEPVTPKIFSPLAFCWEYGGHWAAMLQSGDGQSRDVYIQDRGLDGNKIYAEEAGDDLGGNIRRFTNNYRVKYLADPDKKFLGI
jgi:hypothetical protein